MTIAARLRALLLALLVVAGNVGLPAADALLDHAGAAPHGGARVHFESAGGCRSHADHCPLGRLLSAPWAQARAGHTLPLPSAGELASGRLSATAGAPRTTRVPPPSRGPPGPTR